MPRISFTSLFKPASGDRANLRLSIGLAVAAVVVVEALLALAPDRMAAREIRAATSQLAGRGDGNIVILGDSVAAGGIDERIVADRLGVERTSVENLSIPGTTLLYAPRLLARQLASGNRPQLVVVSYQLPGYALPEPRKFLSHFADGADTAYLLSLGAAPRDVAAGAAGRLSFTLRASGDLRALLLNGDTELIQAWDREPFGFARRAEYLEETEQRQGDGLTMAQADLAPKLRGPWAFSPLAERALAEFIDLARSEDIPVVFAPPPLRPAVAEGFLPARDELAGYFRDAGVTAALVPEPVYPDRHFLDPVHLESTGRERFSAELADALSPVYRTVRTR